MTINATAMWLLALYQVVAEEQNPDLEPARGRPPAGRHHPERHHQGVPLPRHLRVPARALAAADHRRDRLHRPRDPEVEPDQHLQLPPAGGRARRRRRSSPTRCAPRSPCSTRSRPPARSPRRTSARSSAGSRSSSTPACGSSRRCARCAPSCSCGTRSPASATASPTRRCAASATASRSTRLGLTEAQPENNVQRIVLEMLGVTLSQGRPGPRRPAARVERGARPAAAVGPAVVAAAPAGAGLRVRPAGVRRHLRRLARDRGQGRPSWSRAPAPRSTGCRRWAARSRRSSPAT